MEIIENNTLSDLGCPVCQQTLSSEQKEDIFFELDDDDTDTIETTCLNCESVFNIEIEKEHYVEVEYSTALVKDATIQVDVEGQSFFSFLL